MQNTRSPQEKKHFMACPQHFKLILQLPVTSSKLAVLGPPWAIMK